MPRVSLEYERTSGGALTYVRVSGTIDEGFDGRRAAQRINSKRAVINCAGLTLITSFGLRRWLEFVEEMEHRKISIFYVECSPRFVEELNHVVGLVEKGTVLSAYAPYECPSCRFTRSVLLRMDTDAEIVKSRQPPSFSCLTCGGAMEFDDNPAAFFPGLLPFVDRPSDDVVLGFLEARLGYGADVERQLQIQKLLEGDTTVLWFGGTLDSTLNGGRLAEGLQGNVVLNLSDIIHVQQPGIRAWREFLNAAAGRAKLLLVGCPALIIEKALEGVDTQSGLDVLSVRIPYACVECDTTEFVLLDLTSREGQVVRQGRLPEHKCSGCKSETRAMVGASLLGQMANLPEPKPPPGIARVLKRAAKQIQATRASARKTEKRPPLTLWVAASAATVVLGIGAALGASHLLQSDDNQPAVTKAGTGDPSSSEETGDKKRPEFERPDWISSDVPSSSYCMEEEKRLSCVGVSGYHKNREEAEKEAFHAAVEALLHNTVLSGRDKAAAAQQEAYLAARTAALEALEQARYEGNTDKPFDFVRRQRKNVASALRRQRPPGAPAQRSSWHWEEYETAEGVGTEFIVFVRVDASRAERAAINRYYTTSLRAGGSVILPAHPGVGWAVDLEEKSAFLVQRAGRGALRKAGVEDGDVLVVAGKVKAEDLDGVLKKVAAGDSDAAVSVRRGEELSESKALWAGEPSD